MNIRSVLQCSSSTLLSVMKTVGTVVLLSMMVFVPGRALAQSSDLTVLVDGREVSVEAVEEVQLDGASASLDDVLKALGADPVKADRVEVVLPPANSSLPSNGVEAVVEGREISLTNLSQSLAIHGRIRVWISGTNWRICILIDWAEDRAPHVTVDGHKADVRGVTAQIDGKDVSYGEVLTLLGDGVVSDAKIELFDPADESPLPSDGVQAQVKGNQIELTGLTSQLAARGRIGIWVSTSKWRICVVISWARAANPEVMVDGRETKVEGLKAQIDGVDVDYGRVLALLGDAMVSDAKIELFDPADESPLPSDGVQAQVKGNQIELTGLTSQLAARGRIGIWVSTSKWRICVVISWARAANPEVMVDGRETKVEGLKAQIDGVDVDYGRVLALLGDAMVSDAKIELFDPADESPLPSDGVQAQVKGNQIELTGLTSQLAARGRIGIWVSTSKWRICVVISWARAANPEVMVDGRETKVEGLKAQIDGVDVDYGRVLALLGDAMVSDAKIELFDPADESPLSSDGVQAQVKGNQIELTGLTSQLAARGRIGIWVSTSKWRICVVISWARAANPEVMVDGRETKVEGLKAQIDGVDVDYGRVLALLGDAMVSDAKIELFDPADESALPSDGVQAQVKGNQIELTGLTSQLAARGRIGIWVSTSKWRICVVISWARAANPEVMVDGRETKVEGLKAQIDGVDVDYGRVLALLGDAMVSDAKIELFDPADESALPSDGVQAQVKGNQIELTGLTSQLAARGRIGIWVSTSKWRICVVISWARAANPEVMVDGRETKVEGLKAQIDGVDVDYGRVLALLGDAMVSDAKIELFDPADESPLSSDGVQAQVKGNQIGLTGLTSQLAARGRIGIWVSTSKWRICVVISWARAANPEVMVDGRETKVEGLKAQIDGVDVDYGRVLALLGDAMVSDAKIELFDPADESPLSSDGVQAQIKGNQIGLTGLSNQLAARGRIGIWVSTSKWRICVVITLGGANSPSVVVDGRPVTAYGAEATMDDAPVDPRRVLALLAGAPRTASKVEVVKLPDTVLPIKDVTAVINGNRINLTNLAEPLEANKRLGIWVSGTTGGVRWRICVVVVWGRFTSNDDRVSLDFPARNVHTDVLITYTDTMTPTQTTPANTALLFSFQLDAENEDGLPITRFDSPYTIEVFYTEEELASAGIAEEDLQLAYWDEEEKAWKLIPTQVDTAKNVAIGTLDHLTEFALWGSTSGSSGPQKIWLPLISR